MNGNILWSNLSKQHLLSLIKNFPEKEGGIIYTEAENRCFLSTPIDRISRLSVSSAVSYNSFEMGAREIIVERYYDGIKFSYYDGNDYITKRKEDRGYEDIFSEFLLNLACNIKITLYLKTKEGDVLEDYKTIAGVTINKEGLSYLNVLEAEISKIVRQEVTSKIFKRMKMI